MGEFFAWAATGIVVGLQSWSKPARNGAPPDQDKGQPGSRGMVSRQRFFLRQHNGRDIEILLVNSGIAFRNGHAVTAVWAAREKAAYGHCIYLENHTTGAIARLQENLSVIHQRTRWRDILFFGFLSTLPATLIIVGWLYLQRNTSQISDPIFLLSAGVAAILLLVIGIVASKLVFDYLRTEDERRIWMAADKALFHARRMLIQKPFARQYV